MCALELKIHMYKGVEGKGVRAVPARVFLELRRNSVQYLLKLAGKMKCTCCIP